MYKYMSKYKLEQGGEMTHVIDMHLHSQPACWERSHQGSWERSQLARSEHYTIYNAAAGRSPEFFPPQIIFFW
jgi:hypothetical protein